MTFLESKRTSVREDTEGDAVAPGEVGDVASGCWRPLRAWGKGLVMARTKIRIIDHSLPIFFPFLVTFFLCGGAFLANKLFGK